MREKIATFHPDGVRRPRCHYYKHYPPDGGPNHQPSTSVVFTMGPFLITPVRWYRP